MNKVHIDYETRSKVDIEKSGAGRYCTDPSTKILCLAYALNDGPVQHGLGDYYPPIFDVWKDQGYVFVAHNAFFEYMVWKYVWKRPPPKFICTMAKGCAHGLPWKLEKMARALQLKHQKDLEGQRLIRFFCVPKKDGTFNAPEDFPEEFKRFVDYCKQDVRTERAVDDKLPDLIPQEQKIFDLTMKINERGVCVDPKLAEEAMVISEGLKSQCNKEVKDITRGKIHAVTQTVRLKDWINETYNLNLSGIGKEVIENLPTDDLPEELQRILELRLEHGRSSIAKYSRVIDSQCDDGRIRNHMVYHGAGTGRWTSQAVQFHNLPRGGKIDQDICINIIKSGDYSLMDMLYSNPVSALSECIRGVVIAPKGRKLLVADYASIEARVLMWAAGQHDAVKMFQQKKDIYVDMARVIYKNPAITKKNFDERLVGKHTVLGCGFQMGAVKFKATCKKFGVKVSTELSEDAITAYREKYKQVVSFWADMERAAMYTVRTKKACHCGPVTYYIKGKFLYCRLPSGRSLAYYYPGIEDKEMPWGKNKKSLYYFTVDSETKDFKKTFTYGGKLTENAIQAIARDIMASAMIRLEKEGFPVILSVHDEIVCETPIETEDYVHTIDEMLDIMCDVPSWANGCPIDAEGWEGYRYKK